MNLRIQAYEKEKFERIPKDSEWTDMLLKIANYEKEIEELNMDLRSSLVEKEKGKRFEQII